MADGRVCFVAAPLMARSGVYRSLFNLVAEARVNGLPWSGIVGVRPTASGAPEDSGGAVEEFQADAHGLRGLSQIRRKLRMSRSYQDADLVISMISQTDWVLAASRRRHEPWVAYVRGLPWPDAGEQTISRQYLLKWVETLALRRADEVWATTETLANQVRDAVDPALVPAGIPYQPRVSTGASEEGPVHLIWAGRLAKDKRPDFFVEIAKESGVRSLMAGSGELESTLREAPPSNLEWLGWVAATDLWQPGGIFVGTSWREAFGRSAAEAAQAGLPVILSDQYGVANYLYTDPTLRSRFVLPSGDKPSWHRAVKDLIGDPGLRREVSDHVHQNARALTIRESAMAIRGRIPGLVK